MTNIYNRGELFEQLKDIFVENIIDLEKAQIDNYYEYWLRNFNELKSNKLKVSDNLIHKNQMIQKKSVLKGVDLPTWFGDFNNKRIVILGIDPLRNHKVFKEAEADVKNDVILGTPYAFHEKSARDKDCKSYWTLVEGLKNANNFVYCTDIFKTYYYNEIDKIRSYRDPDYTKNLNHLKILKQELELVQPDIIIVFGQLAHTFLLNKKCPKISQSILDTKSIYSTANKSAEVYTVLHLSKTPRGNNFKIFLENNGINTKAINVEDRVQCAEKYLDIFKRNNII